MNRFLSSGDGRNAFTLIELMVVVVLIGIMTAVILPEMKGTYEDALLRSTSRELINALQLASSRSVSFNQQHHLRLDSKTGKYTIEKLIRDRAGETFVPLRDVPGGTGELDTRISIEIHKAGEEPANPSDNTALPEPGGSSTPSAHEQFIAFYPDGTAERAEIVLQDRDHFRLALRINPITARVRVVELARE